MKTDTATARIVGILFIVATGAAVAGDLLLRPIRDDPDLVDTFSGHESRVIVGVLSELVLAVAVIAISTFLFPVLRRWWEGLSLTYVGVRIVEAVIIVIGALSSLLLLTLSEEYAGAGRDEAGVEPLGDVLFALREWTDPLGPMIVFGISALILYTLLYGSRVVPRWLSIWGLVGGAGIVIAGLLGLYGESPTSTTSVLLTLPIGLNEMVLAVWLIVRGFTSPDVGSDSPVPAAPGPE